ncbi:MAG: hypothetical protein FJ137_18825 [Deltaproteobacteria bacterium]|nr:hypothetical protein [Deltaproteobacteria bacterium]
MGLVVWCEDVQLADVARVGGKNAGLGELTRALAPRGVRALPGFAVDCDACRRFVGDSGLEWRIDEALATRSAGSPTASW